MSWLSKSVKKLKKSAKKIASKAVRNPLAIVNPQTYLGGASTGAAGGAATGKSASTYADLAGSAAVVGGAVLATAGLAAEKLGSDGLDELYEAENTFEAPKQLVSPDIAGKVVNLAGDYFAATAGGDKQVAANEETLEVYSPLPAPSVASSGPGTGPGDLMTYAVLGLVGLVAVVVVARAVR